MKTKAEETIVLEKLTSLFKEAETNPNVLDGMIENPLNEIESLGVSVEESLRDAVAANLKSYSQFTKEQNKPLAVPQSFTVKTQSAALKSEPIKVIYWVVGVTLRLDNETSVAVKDGMDITAAGLGAISGVLGVIGELFGKAAGLIGGIIASSLAINAVQIGIANKGKGVYLSWNIIQLNAAIVNLPAAPIIASPTITTVY